MSETVTDTTRHAVLTTATGALSVVVDDVGLRGIYFPEHWTRPDEVAWGPRADPDEPAFATVGTQLAEYLTGRRRTFDLPLHLVGSDQARRVWDLLLAIPYGATTTYGALAAQVGGTHARAVGHFVGHNPVSIIVPCHRVVGASGSLTGYAGGLERKEQLLMLEGSLPQSALW